MNSGRPTHTAVDKHLDSQSTQMLAKMIDTYGRLYQKLDGFWYLSVMNRWGNDCALDRDLWVWKRTSRYEVKLLSEALGVSGKKDLNAFLWVFAASPITMVSKYSVENMSDGTARITITECPILKALEKEGTRRELTICHTVDPTIFGFYASYIGSELTIEPIKLPPRNRNDEVCCQWRLRSKSTEGSSITFQQPRLEEMPRQILIGLIKAYCRLYQVVNAQWHLAIKDRWGNEPAMENTFWVWERLPKSEIQAISNLLDINDKSDLESFIKLFLSVPMNMVTDYTIQSAEPERFVITFTHCPTLRALEKEGHNRVREVCHRLDVTIFGNYAKIFNPAIHVRPIALPPRTSPSDPACSWEFTLEHS